MEAVIFDLDGVIVDTEPLSKQHERDFLRGLGVKQLRKLDTNLQGLNARAYWAVLKDAYELDQSVEELVTLWRPSYVAYLDSLEQIPVIAGVEQLIQQLAISNYPLAIASSANPKRVTLILDKTDLKKYFSVIITGDDTSKSKPAPDTFLLAAKRLGVSPVDCLVIEDSTNGILAAKAAGMQCVAYAGSAHNSDDLSAADVIVTDFYEFARHLHQGGKLADL
jgi:HAD superfamily hydrolase (TIGR01509 family)